MADYKTVKPSLSSEVELSIKILSKVTLATLTDIKLLASRLKVPQTAKVTISDYMVTFTYSTSSTDPLPESNGNFNSNRAWIDQQY